MALNHVPHRARRFVERRPALDAQRFRRSDLHVIDEIAVPERLEDAVAKAEHQQVLHRLFAEIMIDAIDLRFVEYAAELSRSASRAEAPSRPNGFSMIIRVQESPFFDFASPARPSCSMTCS